MPLHSLSRAMHVSTFGRSATCSALHAGQPHDDVAGAPRGHSTQKALVGATETVRLLLYEGITILPSKSLSACTSDSRLSLQTSMEAAAAGAGSRPRRQRQSQDGRLTCGRLKWWQDNMR